eukprot:CAMPEP_0201902744 /NCGR_PEP_ID=MMETSP0902-20130614/55113_1 /ASSEMBLY_ACC=CAM_ASM_000551 /TAXON_ID=420261 /ORGANISM="Thalassiosira antarctica, Strain CCMP982" /LENGTH=724 /DNA_ID=CAMNT_0048436761 /DNA_START=83 /DNA_END=2258 /DNA_ORIENTATION=+
MPRSSTSCRTVLLKKLIVEYCQKNGLDKNVFLVGKGGVALLNCIPSLAHQHGTEHGFDITEINNSLRAIKNPKSKMSFTPSKMPSTGAGTSTSESPSAFGTSIQSNPLFASLVLAQQQLGANVMGGGGGGGGSSLAPFGQQQQQLGGLSSLGNGAGASIMGGNGSHLAQQQQQQQLLIAAAAGMGGGMNGSPLAQQQLLIAAAASQQQQQLGANMMGSGGGVGGGSSLAPFGQQQQQLGGLSSLGNGAGASIMGGNGSHLAQQQQQQQQQQLLIAAAAGMGGGMYGSPLALQQLLTAAAASQQQQQLGANVMGGGGGVGGGSSLAPAAPLAAAASMGGGMNGGAIQQSLDTIGSIGSAQRQLSSPGNSSSGRTPPLHPGTPTGRTLASNFSNSLVAPRSSPISAEALGTINDLMFGEELVNKPIEEITTSYANELGLDPVTLERFLNQRHINLNAASCYESLTGKKPTSMAQLVSEAVGASCMEYEGITRVRAHINESMDHFWREGNDDAIRAIGCYEKLVVVLRLIVKHQKEEVLARYDAICEAERRVDQLPLMISKVGAIHEQKRNQAQVLFNLGSIVTHNGWTRDEMNRSTLRAILATPSLCDNLNQFVINTLQSSLGDVPMDISLDLSRAFHPGAANYAANHDPVSTQDNPSDAVERGMDTANQDDDEAMVDLGHSGRIVNQETYDAVVAHLKVEKKAKKHMSPSPSKKKKKRARDGESK